MANWLNLKKLRDWDFCIFPGFQYDDVSNELIEQALADTQLLNQVNPQLDWEDDGVLMEAQMEGLLKHAYRVARIVSDIRSNGLQQTISLDTFVVSRCRACVFNGHHRLRALEFLGIPVGPFDLSGTVDVLTELVRFAGEPVPVQFSVFFNPNLLVPDEFDIVA